MKYLGMPIDEKKLAASPWKKILGKRLLDGKGICFLLEIANFGECLPS
jgi:hypothetical protein